MESLNKKWVVFTIIGIIVSPILISVFCNLADFNQIKLFNAGENGDWISFWGSMLGSVFGVVGTFLVLQIQIKKESDRFNESQSQLQKQIIEENKRFELTQIDNAFFNMLELFQKVQDDVHTNLINVGYSGNNANYFGEILALIDIQKNKFLTEKRDEYIKNRLEDSEIPLKKELINNTSEFVKQLQAIIKAKIKAKVKISDELNDLSSNFLRINLVLKENNFNNISEVVNELDRFYSNQQIGYGKEILNKGLELIDKLEGVKKLSYDEFDEKDKLSDNDILNLVEEVFSSYHSKIGNYLRLFHRLVKQIMSSKLEMDKKKEYLGIIRALLSSQELLVIFYNTFYSIRGEGLKVQLEIKDTNGNKTEFFADKCDIQKFDMDKNGKIDLPFFKYKSLRFEKNDLSKIKSLINDN